MKNYIKPSISFQFFNLSAGGAGGCVMGSNLDSEQSCPVRVPDWPGDFIFTAENTGCTIEAEEGSLCYNIPSEDNRVLGS